MSGLRRLTIKQRLFINGGALVAAMVVMLLILFYQSNQLTSLARTQQLVEQISADVLMLRRHEKDFMMRTDLKYQKRHTDHLELMRQHVQELDSLLKRHDIDNQPLQQFSKLTADYQQSFAEFVKAQQKVGLNAEDGVMGLLRQAASALEQRFDGLNREDLTIKLLQLRRAEKDLLLRSDLAYVEQFNRVQGDLALQLAGDSVSQAALNQYTSQFKALADARVAMGLDETQGVTGVMRKSIHSTEESLKTLEKQAGEAISASVSATQSLALSIFAVVLIAVLALVAMTSRSILRPVLDVCTTIGLIRQKNDFRMRVDVSGKDEMTALASDFNSMLGDFQDLIRTVNQCEFNWSMQRYSF